MDGLKKLANFRSLSLGLSASLIAIVLALALASIILLISGSNPIAAYIDMFQHGTRLDVNINMLNRAVPLFISAVAVSIGFRMNLFNIGVEGQYILAAIIAAEVGGELNLPAPIHVLAIIVTAMVVGATWAAIPGILKVTRGIHEVISTIMLNVIAISFIVAFLLDRWKVQPEPGSFALNLETDPIPKSGRLPSLDGFVEFITGNELTGRTHLNSFILIAIAVGILYWVFISKTRHGFDLRASGMNPFAAQASGVSPGRTIITAMILSGAVAGLVGIPHILGPNIAAYGYNLEFVELLGFNGITVALLGQNHPGGIAIAAIFIGYLDVTSPILDITDSAPREIIVIMQGIIIFVMVIAFAYSRRIREADEAKRSGAALLKQEREE